jgi:hypothetical protein
MQIKQTYRILSLLLDVPTSIKVTQQNNLDFFLVRFSQGEKIVFSTYFGWYPSFGRNVDEKKIKKYKIHGLSVQRYSPPTTDGVTNMEYLFTLRYPDWMEYAHFFIATSSKEEIRLFEEIVSSVRALPTDKKILRCCVDKYDLTYKYDKETLTAHAAMFLYKDRDIRRINDLLAQAAPAASAAPGDLWCAVDHPASKMIVYVYKNGVVERNRRYYQMQPRVFEEFRKAIEELRDDWKRTPDVTPYKPE